MSADQVDEAEETVEVEPSEVLDPGDYNQSQRLKEIHRARKNVREALSDTTAGRAPVKEHTHTHLKLAEAVAFYGYELMPLMDDAGWSSELPESFPWDDVRQFITSLGHLSEQDYPPKYASMVVFGELNKFTREIGLGADLDEGGDEWEV